MKKFLISLLVLHLSIVAFADEKPVSAANPIPLKPYFQKNKNIAGAGYYQEVACPQVAPPPVKLNTKSSIVLKQGIGFKLDEAIRINDSDRKALADDAKSPRVPKDFYGYQINKNCAFVFTTKKEVNNALTGEKVTIGAGARFEFSRTSRLWLKKANTSSKEPEVFEQHVGVYRDDKFIASGNLLCNSVSSPNEIKTSLSSLVEGDWLSSVWDPKCPKNAPAKGHTSPDSIERGTASEL